MQVIIHEIANQRWTLIWIWRVILIRWFGSVQCYAIYMNNHIFSSIQQTCAPLPGMKHNVPQCSLMDDSQSLVSWLGQVSGLAALAAQSCMLTWDFANMGLLTETQEVQGLLINSLTIDRCIKNCHHILLIFCEIALGWMSIIWSQYW